MDNLMALKPQNVWKHFWEICKIPHSSKHEQAISNYVVDFAKRNNIECIVDEVGNVLLRKAATAGMEGRKGIVLQGHLDMVAQKNGDTEFDFLTDSIKPFIDGEWLTADGTTLGADNGIGVAAALAVMESNDIKHGYIEALFTIDEETGMTGAFGLQPGFLKGDILMNLDSEDEGELYVGCAGGIDATGVLPISRTAEGDGFVGCSLTLKGMKGGHSGMEIILQRGNANKAIVRVINDAAKVADLRVVSIDGGDVRNAIPRESTAVLSVEKSKFEEFKAAAQSSFDAIVTELQVPENGMTLDISISDLTMQPLDKESTSKVIALINAHPNGVVRMSDSLEGLVETSINLGVVKTTEDQISIIALLRSSTDTTKDYLASQLVSLFELSGGEMILSGGYGGWTPKMDSPILKTMKESYNSLYGKTPEVKAIHAGLECGIIGALYPLMDMISFGPTIRYPHSPDEKVMISTVEKFYNFLVFSIENAPSK